MLDQVNKNGGKKDKKNYNQLATFNRHKNNLVCYKHTI